MDESLRLAARRVARVTRAKTPIAADGTIETAVVDTASPLRVFLDGSTTVSVPAAIVAGVRVSAGMNVAVWRRGRKLLVLGAYADTNRPLFGTVAVTVAAGTGSATVTYPAGRFTVQPRVVCGCEGGTPFTAQPLSYNGTTGFDVLLTQVGASSYSGTRTVTYTASVAG